jgi:hypothetical protein
MALGKDFEFSFRTAPLQVSGTSPMNGQLYVGLSQPIGISFNSYVVLSSVQASWAIVPSAAGTFTFAGSPPYESPNYVVFTPSGTFQPNTKYTVTITTGVRDMYGAPMKAPCSFSFVTRPN